MTADLQLNAMTQVEIDEVTARAICERWCRTVDGRMGSRAMTYADAAVGKRLQSILGYHPRDLRLTGRGTMLHQSLADSAMTREAAEGQRLGRFNTHALFVNVKRAPDLAVISV